MPMLHHIAAERNATMPAKGKPLPTIWKPPTPDELLAIFEQRFAMRPPVVTLTIILKLRTQRGTEHLLHTTQTRVTNMLHDVTARCFNDLEKIDTGESYQSLSDAVLAFVRAQAGHHSARKPALDYLQWDMATLHREAAGTALVEGIVAAAVRADSSNPDHQGLVLLRECLHRWYDNHADKKMTTTMQHVQEATRKEPFMDVSGKPLKDAEGKPITIIVPKYTTEQIERIKLLFTLRRALVARHTAQTTTLRATGLTVLALRQEAEQAAFAWLNTVIAALLPNRRMNALTASLLLVQWLAAQPYQRTCRALNQRCVGQQTDDLIATLVECVVRAMPPAAQQDTAATDALHAALHQMGLAFKARWAEALLARRKTGALLHVRPFLFHILDALVAVAEHTALLPLATSLAAWYRGLAQPEREQHFSSDERQHVDGMLGSPMHGGASHQRVGMAILLLAWLRQHATLATDVLLLVSLSERAARQLPNNAQMMSDILANCYGEVCSNGIYPLPSQLREAVFANRGQAIVGWCQLVLDYVHKHDRQSERFNDQRVVRMGEVYHLWKTADACYQEVIATKVPVGPDIGKTLGNPNAHAALRRQFAANRRRPTTILGRGVVGKRGARRIKKWLLSSEERKQTLKYLDILLYPELDWDEAARLAAADAPHPYWVKRTKRGVVAVRPSQFRKYSSKSPQKLKDLSHEQRIKLREELREQERYAPQFVAFSQALDHFLEGAPPGLPVIAPILLTEAELADLPPEAQLDSRATFEDYKKEFDRNLHWYYDFIPARGTARDDYSDEKLYDVETAQNQQLAWSAATLGQSRPQPISFKRVMGADLSPRSFTLLYHLQEHHGQERYRFTLVCELVGDTSEERDALLAKDRDRAPTPIENFLVNHPDQRVERPAPTTLQYFATEMGAEHQERLLRAYMDWRRREPQHKDKIAAARITSHRRTSQRTDWYVHLPVPLPVPTQTTSLDSVIGFHEHDGTFFYAVIDLAGKLLALGEIDLPDFVRTQDKHHMPNDNFAFETAVRMVWRSMTRHYAHKLRDTPQQYTAFIGIEDTSWKHDVVGTEARHNRRNVSIPRQRITEIVSYKALRSGLPKPLSIGGISPSRTCGHCGLSHKALTCVEKRPVQHCFHCHTLGLLHTLEWRERSAGEKIATCSTCKRQWQVEELQFKCPHCRTQQYARYNTARATVHATVDALLKRKQEDPSADQESTATVEHG